MSDIREWAMAEARTLSQTVLRNLPDDYGDMTFEIETIARALADTAERVERETRENDLAIIRAYDGKPMGPAQLWTEDQREFYDAGQIDASRSQEAAIAALPLKYSKGETN